MNPMTKSRSWHRLKQFLLLFWAVWFSIVVASNTADALCTLELLPAKFPLRSGNYQAIVEVTSAGQSSGRLAPILFAGVIAWEAACMSLFWFALAKFSRGAWGSRSGALALTFGVSLALWAAFQIACELFPSPEAYRFASVHRTIFIEQLVTLLAIVLLPDV